MITLKRSMQSRQAQSKKGFTLTEIAIVLGIIGLILGAIWVAAASVYNNQKVNRANTEIISIMQGIRTLYATQSSTGVGAATDLTSAMISAGIPPSDMVNGTTLFDPWSSGATGILTPASADSITIAMTNVPQAACTSLISTVAGTGRDPTLFAANSAATSAIAASDAIATASPLAAAVTPSAAVTKCTAAAGNQKVSFGFSLK